jgi:hypothetical protein
LVVVAFRGAKPVWGRCTGHIGRCHVCFTKVSCWWSKDEEEWFACDHPSASGKSQCHGTCGWVYAEDEDLLTPLVGHRILINGIDIHLELEVDDPLAAMGYENPW